MEDQEQENKMDVISVDVPLFIRLLEFAREDATDDMMLHDVAEKLIELCADGDIMQMEQYDEIVGTKVNGADTSGMNAVEDDMQEKQNKDMNTINEQRWMKLAGLITENEANETSSLKVGDYVYVFGGEETEAGEVTGLDDSGEVTVKLDNGNTVKVPSDSVQTARDFFN
jgi:hypothetical protein